MWLSNINSYAVCKKYKDQGDLFINLQFSSTRFPINVNYKIHSKKGSLSIKN